MQLRGAPDDGDAGNIGEIAEALQAVAPWSHGVGRGEPASGNFGRRVRVVWRAMKHAKRGRNFKNRGAAKFDAASAIRESTRLLLRGEHERARKILSAAIEREPGNASLHGRHGDALYRAERAAEAREAYRRALALDEAELQAWYGCGMAEFSYEEYARAIECFERAVKLAPRDLEMHLWLGRARFHMGDVDEAIDEAMIAARSRDEELRETALRFVATVVTGSPRRGNGEILQLRRRWAASGEKRLRAGRASARAGVKSTARRAGRGGKLRIGYVSSFFHHRNWMKPVWGVINEHDREAFEVHLIADEGAPSAESGYKRDAADKIHLITGLTNEQVARRIARAGIDVLVDLNGYSAPERFGNLARRPARVIVGWFNMYATTAFQAFDYIVGDASVIPPEEERFYTERVLRVPGTYLAFRVLYPVPEIVAPPCVAAGHVTFGCLAPQYKITEEMIAAWSEILTGASRARLLLKSTCLDQAANRAAVEVRFARHGVGAERLLMEAPAEHYKFLETYARVDIALDTIPYNGGTTTTEALWQGVPVLAMDGDRWLSRTSKSLLNAAALGEWVQPNKEAYVRRAVELANSTETPGRLAELRAGMRERLLASKACDTAGLCRELEAIYRRAAEGGGEPGHPDGHWRQSGSRR